MRGIPPKSNRVSRRRCKPAEMEWQPPNVPREIASRRIYYTTTDDTVMQSVHTSNEVDGSKSEDVADNNKASGSKSGSSSDDNKINCIVESRTFIEMVSCKENTIL